MRYFILNQDERLSDRPYPNDFFQKIDIRNVTANKAGHIEKRTLITIQPNENTVFPDLLCSPVTLVTKEMKDVIDSFDPFLAYRQIIYLDTENELTQLYFMPAMEEVDCFLSPSAQGVENRGAFSNVILKRAPIRDKALFLMKNKTKRIVIIRMDLAERLLAKGCRGFALTEAVVE